MRILQENVARHAKKKPPTDMWDGNSFVQSLFKFKSRILLSNKYVKDVYINDL